MTATEPTVFVVDDDQGMRDSLHWLITSVDMAVETFASAKEFLEACQPSQPCCLGRSCCIVADVRMAGMSGLDLQEELTRRGIEIPVIVITGYGDVPMAVRAMKAGAFDFIQKPFNDQALLEIVQKAVKQSAETDRNRFERDEILKMLDLLTARERQVLDGIIGDLANKAIAHRLGLSEKTIEFHRAKVMEKMKAQSLVDLVRKVMPVSGSLADPVPPSANSSFHSGKP
ncbi:MAG: response regulator [Rhodospirillales bacterium]|nr:response regulator [Rhodospirillales bacterium]